jgi:acetylornithine deacetylase/succinyl-diaminopimelate desuccinylase-like protein
VQNIAMDATDCLRFAEAAWSDGGAALEGLKDFIRIPNLTPAFDSSFFTNGLIQTAAHCVRDWIVSQQIRGLEINIYDSPNVPPIILAEIPAVRSERTIVIYGHIDKMPHLDLSGWSPGLSPTNPVVRDGHLYGRGSTDDGYSYYLAFTALRYLQEHDLPHPHIWYVIESSEESGDEVTLTEFVKEKLGRIGVIDAVFVLDSSAEDDDTAWFCQSLRGGVMAILDVQHLAQPCHSGLATGLVPSTFRIARILLDRLEDEQTGEIKLKSAVAADIPKEHVENLHRLADRLAVTSLCRLVEGARFLRESVGEMAVDRAWKAGLAVTGADGLPAIGKASNVLRAQTKLRLSLRLPPTSDHEACGAELKQLLEANPPYGAQVNCDIVETWGGWLAKPLPPAVAQAFAGAANAAFGADALGRGTGPSIGIVTQLQALWPDTCIIVTGASLMKSGRAHGYDENIDIVYVVKWTAFFAGVLSRL